MKVKDYLLDGRLTGRTFMTDEGEKYTVRGINIGRHNMPYMELGNNRVRGIGAGLEDIEVEMGSESKQNTSENLE